jgi:hypothetical protein
LPDAPSAYPAYGVGGADNGVGRVSAAHPARPLVRPWLIQFLSLSIKVRNFPAVIFSLAGMPESP